MSFGTRLREARLNIGLSQRELAPKIGVSNTAVSNYEKEVSFPNSDVLYRLFDVLGCDANFLFQDYVTLCRPAALLADEQELLDMYRAVNMRAKSKLRDYALDLADNPKYAPVQAPVQAPLQPSRPRGRGSLAKIGMEIASKVPTITRG